MPNKVAVDQQAKDMIIELGLLIHDCRGTLSQSQLAKRVGLPRSNMKYIEDGVNAPTAEVYEKLIKELKPDLHTRQRMDRLYMAIRKVPPPDVCRTITQNTNSVYNSQLALSAGNEKFYIRQKGNNTWGEWMAK